MRVAVLGMGHMGSPIAARLLDAGHDLFVWNRSPAATEVFGGRAGVLPSPAATFSEVDLAVTVLADDAAVKAVTTGENGILSGDGSGVLVDMSTISVETSAQVAKACEERGVTYLRAPVSGNPSVVVAGNLGIIVSGPEQAYETVSPTLRDIGPNLFYVGAGDESRIVKLALNLMLGGTTQLLAEALVLAERSGIEMEQMLEVICGSAVGSPYIKYKSAGLIAGDYSSTFTANLLYKDLGLALAEGHASGVPLPLTAATQQLVQNCIESGMGDLDLSVLLPRLRSEAGD
jgi:3-hydroxyisobutyrate dehydrogenase-like beta-hydroxyacid dehydrogenase